MGVRVMIDTVLHDCRDRHLAFQIPCPAKICEKILAACKNLIKYIGNSDSRGKNVGSQHDQRRQAAH